MRGFQKGQRVLVSSEAGDELATVTSTIYFDEGMPAQVHFVTDDQVRDWLPAWCVQKLTATSETEMLSLRGLEADGILQVVR